MHVKHSTELKVIMDLDGCFVNTLTRTADYEYVRFCTGFLGYSLNNCNWRGIFSEASGTLLWQLPLCVGS